MRRGAHREALCRCYASLASAQLPAEERRLWRGCSGPIPPLRTPHRGLSLPTRSLCCTAASPLLASPSSRERLTRMTHSSRCLAALPPASATHSTPEQSRGPFPPGAATAPHTTPHHTRAEAVPPSLPGSGSLGRRAARRLHGLSKGVFGQPARAQRPLLPGAQSTRHSRRWSGVSSRRPAGSCGWWGFQSS